MVGCKFRGGEAPGRGMILNHEGTGNTEGHREILGHEDAKALRSTKNIEQGTRNDEG